jgi:hypothetical protein
MEQKMIRCTVMRAGTSKGIFLHENDLPAEGEAREQTLLKIFGSPDVRQIDGLGGADPLTSKVAIIAPPASPDVDVNYTFGQVGITQPLVDFSGNCGNISSGVGPFAIDEGLVKAVAPVTTVRIYNTNTGKILVAEVQVKDGKAAVDGEYSIAGVPGAGAKIMMDFAGTAGAVTGKMLPTGNVKDVFNIEGLGKIEVSIVDVANPMVFVRASDLGLTGLETPAEIDGSRKNLDLLESIRAKAAVRIGMAETEEEATQKSPAFPMLAFVGPAQDYRDYISGRVIRGEDVDLVARLMFMQVMHKTYAGTGTTCTGAAAKIPGTIVNEAACKAGHLVRIGHPAGVIEIEVASEKQGDQIVLKRAAFGRTARRIMSGHVYIR